MNSISKVIANVQELELRCSSPDISVQVEQVKSAIGREKNQQGTLIGLGLRKIGSKSVLPCTAANVGMMRTVFHLINVSLL